MGVLLTIIVSRIPDSRADPATLILLVAQPARNRSAIRELGLLLDGNSAPLHLAFRDGLNQFHRIEEPKAEEIYEEQDQGRGADRHGAGSGRDWNDGHRPARQRCGDGRAHGAAMR
ncbi:hypothetical protein GCM10007897_26440 [Sphingobium jiangsuense]|uniref:Uncharacterized protein n=1 Tax=Sphingobium jiangsuense TaxID=870476 RepID=A0A7W6BIP1_9SPHN|nr:hypothetical protein [Sphingobium jiangsuense]MBB3925667.1 hypothetical protein [Sphingobium jiangsuense]GLT01252.1 hypothetical protein GCM10007897_26440 [Sphingobium jiangsuense]